jgi:A/G-specific adenine glycosylase
MSTQGVPPELLSSGDRRGLQAAILGWYDARGRSLPFRGTRDPYAILVSEVMAQQTQISRVGPAWEAFTARFPTFGALATALPADVLRAWQGLGYDRRARNLQRTAKIVVEEHGGKLPTDLATLERLPGIGPYTARAVAAIAFDAPVGAVDTNVRRVLGRVAVGDPAALRPREMQVLADGCVPGGRAADWTHAVMDVGATFCRTTRPACGECPARALCQYAASVDAGAGEAPVERPGSTDGGARERVRFEQTTRWLRGRILDRARSADGAAWTRFDGPIGSHPHESVVAMLGVLGREGMLELAPADRSVARLPHGPLVTSAGRDGRP